MKLSQQYQDSVHIHCSQKELSHSYLFLIPTLHSQATADLLSVTIDYFIFLEFCINGIMLYLTIIIFWLCFLEFLPCCCIPFYTESSFSVRIFHNLFIHSAIDGYLGCFLFLVIINKVLWTFVYVFFFMKSVDTAQGSGVRGQSSQVARVQPLRGAPWGLSWDPPFTVRPYPMDFGLPGSSVHRIFQVKILKWVAMPSSMGFSRLRDRTCVSCFLHWQEGSLPGAPPGKPSFP